MNEKLTDSEVRTRFADIAMYERVADLEAMLHAAGIPIITRKETQAAAHPPTCKECTLCSCTCDMRCVCNRTHRHTP
jgi:hypothetical protein